MADNIFKKIMRRELPTDVVFENDDVIAIKDIQPVAPLHVLIIPKRDIVNIDAAEDKDCEILGKLLLTARDIAKKAGIGEEGYRLVFNTNRRGQQTVPHLHLHLLGGRDFTWPPG